MDTDSPPLLIRHWKGSRSVLDGLAGQNFCIPQKYIEYTHRLSGLSMDVWKERVLDLSDEYVSSGNRVLKNSAIAERLAAVQKTIALDAAARDEFLHHVSLWRKEELGLCKHLRGGWSEAKSYHRELFHEVARRENWTLTRKGFGIRVGGQIELENEVDSGRPGSTVKQILLLTKIKYTLSNHPWSMYLSWEKLLPGMLCYSNGNTPEEIVWGVNAYCCAIKSFVGTFTNGPF